jgi:hypothetical protein
VRLLSVEFGCETLLWLLLLLSAGLFVSVCMAVCCALAH